MIQLILILTIIIDLAVIFSLIYVLILARPSAKPPKSAALLCDYAHRGLHGNGIPENSLAAFALACERGFAIELDVHLSADKEVVVFHDATLERMTGNSAKIGELTYTELRKLKLADTDEYIPTLKEVLALVNGRVPLLVELKGENTDTSLCPKVAEILRGYSGEYCIESFNPMLLSAMRKELPDAYFGLLYTNVCREKNNRSLLSIALTGMALNVLARPNFIAFDYRDRNSFPVKLTTRFYRAPKFVWTIRSDDELAIARQNGECPIFEHCNSGQTPPTFP